MPLGSIARYLAPDRLSALSQGAELGERASGAALLGDIAGFTALSVQLSADLGAKAGIEELARRINTVYQALDARVERQGGGVVGFAGDALLCWFEGSDGKPAQRALACARSMQHAMRGFGGMGLKVAIACGSARRMAVGDPAIQRLDVLGGATIERLASAQKVARQGEVVVDRASASAFAAQGIVPLEWREVGNASFARVEAEGTEDPDTSRQDAGELDMEVLRPWILPAVFERERSGHGAFLTELRPTVALFVQIAGINYDSDGNASTKLDEAVRRVQGIGARHGGALLQLTLGEKGGYAYLSFGAPQAHENNALRAVRAALELRAALGELACLHPVRIGLSGGVARCGAYGAPTRATYGALGDDVNLAARLMAKAAPGEVLVSEALHRALAEDYTFRPLRSVAIHGRSGRVGARAVVGERRSQAVRLQERRYGFAMVGRQRELALADEALRLAVRGSARVVGISGEAGVGKSRLVAEILARAQRHGFKVVTGLCEATGQWSPYLAWRPVWRALFGVDEDVDLPLLRKSLRELVPQREPALPTLAPLLGVQIDESEFTRTLQAQERVNVLTAVLEEALAAIVAQQPLLIVIEDLHWVDPASLQLLEALMRGAVALPLAMVLAYRPAEKPDDAQTRAARLPGYTAVELEALPPAEVAQLVAARLTSWEPDTSPALAHALAQRLDAQAEGNPFYIEELLNHLHDRRVALREWAEDASLAVELPPNLESLILSRIDRLNETQRATLKVASVIGRRFRVNWLHGCHPALGEIAQVKAELVELDRLDLTPLDSPEPLAYMFKHVVTREVTYDSVARATRSQLHGQFARHVESLGADQHLELLAHHYGLSDDVGKQREYFMRAAEAAQAAYANETALEHWRRLLPLALDDAQRAHILCQQGVLLTHTADYVEAGARLRDALALSERAGDERARATAAEALGVQLHRSGDPEAARASIDRALAAWQSLGAAREEGRALLVKASTWLPGRPDQVRDCAEHALEISRACGDTVTEILAAAALGEAVQRLGEGDRARALLGGVEGAARQLGDKRVLLPVLHRCGIVAAAAGEYAWARSLLVEAHALAREMGDKLRAIETLWLIGNQDNRLGHYELARSSLEAAVRMARQVGAKAALLSTLYGIAYGAVRQSNHVLARACLEEALALAEALHDTPRACKAMVGIGYVDLSIGDLNRAEASFAKALSIVDAYDLPMLRAEVLDKMGLVALARGHLEEAGTSLSEVLRLRRSSGHVESLAYTLAKVAALRAQEGRHGDAAMLSAVVEEACRKTGFSLDAYTSRLVQDTIDAARHGLPSADFADAQAQGVVISIEDAVDFALGPPGSIRQPSDSGSVTP